MTLQDTKAQIAALLVEYLDEPVMIESKPYGTSPTDLCTVADLKALATSHNELLEAAKKAGSEIYHYPCARIGGLDSCIACDAQNEIRENLLAAIRRGSE